MLLLPPDNDVTQAIHAILRTLAYADIFDFPLTKAEIWRYWIGKPARIYHFQSALTALIEKRILTSRHSYFCLAGREQIFRLRRKRQQIASLKLPYVQRTVQLLRLIPTVWFIGISGAFSMENAPFDDDIDLFIICAPQTVWMTRLKVTVLLDILGWRRKPGQHQFANKMCLNMFQSADALSLPPTERDLYAAHEIVQLKPVFDRYQSYERFLYANRWVSQRLPHALKPALYTQLRPRKMTLRRTPSLFEQVSRSVQWRYMQKRRTQEVIAPTRARFHPIDAREWVRAAYQARLSTCGVRKTWWDG